MQRYFAVLECGTNLNRERLATTIALVSSRPGALALQSSYAFDPTTVRANWTVWPDMRFDEIVGRFFVPEHSGAIFLHYINLPRIGRGPLVNVQCWGLASHAPNDCHRIELVSAQLVT